RLGRLFRERKTEVVANCGLWTLAGSGDGRVHCAEEAGRAGGVVLQPMGQLRARTNARTMDSGRAESDAVGEVVRCLSPIGADGGVDRTRLFGAEDSVRPYP